PARTALLESRLLTGNADLYHDLQRRVERMRTARWINRFVDDCLVARSHEHDDYYAPTVCLLEPNMKKSPGGLRDRHLFRWIALARYGTADSQTLQTRGLLSAEDAEQLARAAEFLMRVRNELHFAAGGDQDVLTREEQIRVAA